MCYGNGMECILGVNYLTGHMIKLNRISSRAIVFPGYASHFTKCSHWHLLITPVLLKLISYHEKEGDFFFLNVGSGGYSSALLKKFKN